MSDFLKSQQVSELRRIDRICSEFERQHRAGDNPRLETALNQGEPEIHEPLFLALLASELEQRQERGEYPQKSEYIARFPLFAHLIDSAWPSVIGGAEAGVVAEGLTEPVSVTPSADQDSPTSRIRIGRFQVVREIARGGMGIVYFARDTHLGREVALKVILSGHFAAPSDVQRFELEGRAVARLNHPGIVQIYEFGKWAGHHYLAMNWIDGQDLAKSMEQGPILERQAAEWVRDLADAVDYAHRTGVIHRDLKPRNVMIDSTNRPRITDFGLAKMSLDSSSATSHDSNGAARSQGVTSTGQILGTPHYMSPEQAAGRHNDVGALTDVYALGVILYELLGGRVPFGGDSAFSILQAIQNSQAPHLSRLRPGLSRDLITICEKCMEKDPRRRYATAAGLRDELDRYLRGLPILARPVGIFGQLWRWALRNPLLASLSLVLVTLVLGALITLTSILLRLRQEMNDKAKALASTRIALRQRDVALDESHASERLAQQRAYAARMMAASRAWEDGDVTRVTDLLESTKPRGTLLEFRGFEWDYLHRQVFHNLVYELQIDGGEIGQIEFNSAGNRLLVCGGSENTGFCEVIDLETRTRVGRFDRVNSIINVARLSPIDGRIVLGAPEKGLLLFDAALQQVIAQCEVPADAWRSMAWSPDGRLLAAGSQNGTVVFWRFPSLEHVAIASAHTGPVLSLCFSADGTQLYSSTEWGTEGRLSRQWELGSWPPAATRALPGFTITDIADGGNERLATREGTLARIDHATHEIIATREVSRGFLVPPLYLMHGDRILVAARTDRVNTVLDGKSLATLAELPLRNSPTAIATAEKLGLFACGDVTGMIRVWQDAAPPPRPLILERDSPVTFLATCGHRDEILLGTPTDSEVLVLNDQRENSTPVQISYVRAASADGSVVAALSPPSIPNPTSLSIYDWPQAKKRMTIALNERPYRDHLVLSPTGRWLATHSESGSLKLFDLQANSSELRVDSAQLFRDMVFSPDERYLYLAGQYGIVSCLHLPSLKFERNYAEHESFWGWGFCIDCSPDGRRLAVGNHSGLVRVWDTQTREQESTLLCSPGIIHAIKFFPDNRRLVVSDGSGVRVCDVETGDDLLYLPDTSRVFESLAVGRYGNIILAAAKDGPAMAWFSSMPGKAAVGSPASQ